MGLNRVGAAAEQQQQLLIQGRFASPPTSGAHMADRMEAGGAKIEETLSRLNCKYTTLFFVAGWVTIASAIAAFFASITRLSFPGLLQAGFLMYDERKSVGGRSVAQDLWVYGNGPRRSRRTRMGSAI